MTEAPRKDKVEEQQEKFNWGHFLLLGVFAGGLFLAIVLPRVFGVSEASVERWIMVCMLPLLIVILWKHK